MESGSAAGLLPDFSQNKSGVLAVVLILLLFSGLAALLAALAAVQRQESSKHGKKGRRRAEENHEAEKREVPTEWLERIRVSEADVQRIRSFPQRKCTGRASVEWLRHRRHRLTASRFHQAIAAMAEDGLRCDAELSCRQVIEDMIVQPEAQTSPHRFGIANEPKARQSYEGYRLQSLEAGSREHFSVEETGLCVWEAEPWLAASPDGVVRESGQLGALEIKSCREASRMFSVENIPAEYYDQMQGEMAIMSAVFHEEVAWCDFFVWSPSRRRCRRVTFDREYFFGQMLPKLRAFYFSRYVPIARSAPLGAAGNSLRRSVGELVKERQKRGWAPGASRASHQPRRRAVESGR